MQIWWGTILVFILVEIIWPCLTMPAIVWSRGYFKFQVILGFFIAITSAFIGIFLPLWEGREEFLAVCDWMLGREQRSRGIVHHTLSQAITTHLLRFWAS